MSSDDRRSGDDDRLAKITRAVGAIIFVVICFGFGNDVQNGWLGAVLGAMGILALIWGVFPFLRRKS